MGLKYFSVRIDRVKYTAHYDEFGNLKDQWIGMEAIVDDTEIPERQLDKIKQMTDSWYKENNPHVNASGYPNLLNPDELLPVISNNDPKIGITTEDIMSCQDLVTIDSYRLLIKGKEELENAYATRRKQIVDDEIATLSFKK